MNGVDINKQIVSVVKSSVYSSVWEPIDELSVNYYSLRNSLYGTVRDLIYYSVRDSVVDIIFKYEWE
jgi:hypothetical protein